MRTKRGCQSCRSRHIKCVTEAGSSVCARCKESQRSCLFDSKFRFKSVDHVDTASQGVRSRTRLVYDDDQFWVPTKQALGFILEDGAGAEYGTADFIERDECSDEAVEICEPRQPDTGLLSPPGGQIAPSGSQEIGVDDQASLADNGIPSENIIVPTLSGNTSPETAWQPHIIGEQELAQQQHEANGNSSGTVRNSVPIAAIVEDYTSPASLSELSRRHDSGRRLTWGTGEYGFLIGDSSPAMEVIQTPASATAIDLSHREALLMQHFIQKLAPWIDCCDHICHFAQEVPKRAVRVPMVLYAILALSSRHQSSITGCDELEASYYHGQCVELVIDALSKPESSYDDNLFATIVCLRIYEELDETVDAFLHLQGVGRLLHAIPNFAHAGGLAEAASWQALRQDVYVAIHNKSQPTLDLENYGRSRVFDFRDEDACANVVILLFARMLRLLHSPSGASDYGAWNEIEQHIKLWDAQRSLLFQPLFVKEASASEDQPFPVLRLINPAQVVALQYYNACLVLLRQHKPPDLSLAGFEAVKERRNVERNLVIALGNVVGLAESNAWVQNANFTAHHMLRSSGYHINNPKQREHSIDFLHRIQQVMGFKTQSTIALLLDQWRDLD